jgi:NAD(P)-dependent dehydrogenase (short-subunit alcohol dehydrogenase family)
LASYGIRVNAIAPDITLTEGLAALNTDAATSAMANIVPLGRPGHVDEIAGTAVFLASDMSVYLTGQTLHVDGGTHAASGWYHDPQTGAYRLGPSG